MLDSNFCLVLDLVRLQDQVQQAGLLLHALLRPGLGPPEPRVDPPGLRGHEGLLTGRLPEVGCGPDAPGHYLGKTVGQAVLEARRAGVGAAHLRAGSPRGAVALGQAAQVCMLS